jgi:hypothetical protein
MGPKKDAKHDTHDETKKEKRRKGRPLLIAAAGVAFVSYVQCRPKEQPVGNLRPVDPIPTLTDTASASAPPTPTEPPIQPVGNLRPAPSREDAGSPSPDAGKPVLPNFHPVGNLRPPPVK